MSGRATKTLGDLEWGRLLEAIATRCASEPGAAASRAPIFSDDRAAVAARYALVDEAMRLLEDGIGIELGPVRAIGPLLERARIQGALDVAELRDVAATLGAACQASRLVGARRALYPGLTALVSPAR